MTEFKKTKIAFSLTLLAALFSLSPLLGDIGDIGYIFISVKLKVKFVYYSLSLVLGLTVYVYAIQLISDEHSSILDEIANLSYSISILIPPLYVMLFLATKFVSLIGILVKLPLALDVIKIVLGVFLGVIGSRFVGSFMGNLRTKDLDSESKQRAVTLGQSYGKHSQQGIRAESWIEVDTDTATHYIMIANYRATSLIIQTSSRIIDHGITYEGDTTDWHRQSILPPATRHRWMPASATWLKSGMPLVISTSHQAGQATFEAEVRYELGRGSEQFNRIMLVLKV